MQARKGQATVEPITLDEAKAYMKVDYTDEDTLIGIIISAVREEVEEFTGLSLAINTIEVFDDEIQEEIRLPYPAHDEILELKLNGVVSTDYTKTGMNQFVVYPAQISVVGIAERGIYCKYTTKGTCPAGVKLELLKIIDERYRNRGNTFEGSITQLTENAFANLAKYCLQ
jgi:hypothetical protein